MTENNMNQILLGHFVANMEEDGMSPENIFTLSVIAIGENDVLIHEGAELSSIFNLQETMRKIVCTFIHNGFLFRMEVEGLTSEGKVKIELNRFNTKLLDNEHFDKCIYNDAANLN